MALLSGGRGDRVVKWSNIKFCFIFLKLKFFISKLSISAKISLVDPPGRVFIGLLDNCARGSA